MKVWSNGDLLDAADVRISPFDHGLTVGDGVFETIDIRRGQPFALTRHLQRLARSADGLGIAVPDLDLVRRAVDEVVAANRPERAAIRVTVTSGDGPIGSGRGDGGPTILVYIRPTKAWPPSEAVWVVPWPRNERGALAGVKTTSYGENAKALAYAHERGASEAIFGNTLGNLCEGTGTNVFVVTEGELITPPLGAGCLAGVTRELVLELGLGALERDLPLSALAKADEAFLTSTTRDVGPIASVDGTPLPNGTGGPGPVAKRCQSAFEALVARTLDP